MIVSIGGLLMRGGGQWGVIEAEKLAVLRTSEGGKYEHFMLRYLKINHW